jgi:hypothetical protein
VKVPRRIDVLKGGKLAMQISITDITSPEDTPPITFELKGHAWQRAFTSEMR